MTPPAGLREKKHRRREIRKLRSKLGWIDIPVTYDRSDLTGLGHLPLFVNFAKLIGLEDSLVTHLHLRRRERRDGFTATQMLWTLTDAVLYGIDRVDNISLLGTDALPPLLHGLDRIPTAQAARDFLECFTEENVRELLAVNRDVISNVTGRREPVTVSFLSVGRSSAGWARKSLKTVRAYVLKVPGVVRRVGKGFALALPVAFPLQALMSEAAGRLMGLALGGSG